jgi:hydroxyacylglutathione hydrolase
MILEAFHLPALGHASYLLGSEETGEALLLDVRRDVDVYFEAARRHGLRLRHAADTHQHNDYVSGICELPDRAEVQLLAGARAEVGYPVRRLDDGDVLEMGEIRLTALHTPGHTPEHVAYLVTDRSRGETPVVLFSGGALLVGDVARPDLLGGRAQAEALGRTLLETLRDRILTLPDHVEIRPTHVSGSLCGGHIASRLSTTLGYERRTQALLRAIDDLGEGETPDPALLGLDALPAVPPYWRRMRRLNSDGPPRLGVLAEPPPLDPAGLCARRARGACILDTRDPESFSVHVPGALNAGLHGAFPTWAGTVLPGDAEIVLVLDRPADLWDACWHLLRIGHRLPVGWLAGGMRAWRSEGREVSRLPQWTIHDLARARQGSDPPALLDVRQPGEWDGGVIRGAIRITGAEMPRRLEEVPDGPVAVICGSGYRSSAMASVLLAAGRGRVHNVLGGMSAWKATGLPVEAPGASSGA